MTTQIQGIHCKNKKLILQIISAYGFGLLKGLIVVHATFMKKQIHNNAVSVNNEYKFTSNFVWDLDNATLKKFKLINAPIKVECFHSPINESYLNEKLGYLILKIKNAQTIDPSSNDRIESTSYKLMGTKNCSYSFTLSLRIETFETSPKQIKALSLFDNKNINDNGNNFQKDEENTHFVENIKINLPKNNILEQNIVEKKYEPQYFLISDNVLQEVVEESKDDKIAKQITSFNRKMKEQQLLKEFNNKRIGGKYVEEELIREMSKCKHLAETMNKVADLLKKREDIVTAKELKLASQIDYTENRYINLMQDLQSTHTQTVNEFSNRIFELETKLHNLEKQNMSLRNENELLKVKFRKHT